MHFQNGNIYRHNTSPLRNNYYGIQGSSQVTSVFNPEPSLTIKLFKTLSKVSLLKSFLVKKENS
mgnify:CR=1 FL=1